jgi:predicted SnoaL-like aldol condensation-catalyzing enzyme
MRPERKSTDLAAKAALEERNVRLVLEMFERVLEPMDSAQVPKYFRADYRQHNPLATDGSAGLMAFLAGGRKQYPHARHILKRVFADGDYVIAHTHVVLAPGTPGLSAIDILRIEDGMIVEHWDTIQPVPETSQNSNTMF